MIDMEVSRNQHLIDERIAYENDFISIRDIKKSEELDFYTLPIYEKYIEGIIFRYEEPEMFDSSMEFDLEDIFDEMRDEQLILRKLAEESKFKIEIDEYYAEYDPLGAQIEFLDDYCPNSNYLVDEDYDYIFENYDFYEDDDDYYFEDINMDAAYTDNGLFGYVVDDNESFEEYDYPEGPDENLEGFRYPEPDYFEDSYFEFQDDEFHHYTELAYENEAENILETIRKEESHLQMLIKQHIAEENEFSELMSQVEIPEEYLPVEVKDDIIFG